MEEGKRPMTVREAGRLGGTRTKERHGPEFYRRVGSQGGQKVKRLIAKALELESDAVSDQAEAESR